MLDVKLEKQKLHNIHLFGAGFLKGANIIMNNKENIKSKARKTRHNRTRQTLVGTNEKPRLNVFRSSKNIYAQIIDDESGKTLVATSSLSKDFKSKMKNGGNIKAANLVGTLVAEIAIAKGINKVIFDRGGFLFHGRVKALADAAREKGLVF